jgi:hypothetical protein
MKRRHTRTCLCCCKQQAGVSILAFTIQLRVDALRQTLGTAKTKHAPFLRAISTFVTKRSLYEDRLETNVG